jgi:hypothetical protein
MTGVLQPVGHRGGEVVAIVGFGSAGSRRCVWRSGVGREIAVCFL